MKLAVSNIAWDNDNFSEFCSYLTSVSCPGVELAANKLWTEPIEAPESEVQEVIDIMNSNNLSLVGFHALFYNRPDLKLFAEDENECKDFCDYLINTAKLCSKMGGSVLVLGSPRNRQMPRTHSSSLEKIIDEFRRVAESIKPLGIRIALEHLPSEDTNFVNSYEESLSIVNQVSCSAFQPHLDIGTLQVCGENIKQIIHKKADLPAHVHLNDPGLNIPDKSNYKTHKCIGDHLRSMNYQGFISLEVPSNNISSKHTLNQVIKFMRKFYT